jgi:formylglycine-generating enzyme required for sulfatase activity
MTNAKQSPRLGPFQGTGDEGGEMVLVNRNAAQPTPSVASPPIQADPKRTLAEEDRVIKKSGARMVRIPAGTLWMGSGEADRNADREERPRHQVTLTHAFRMMDVEVGQALFESVSGRNPSSNTACGANCPVERTSWSEAVDFANALSAAEGLEKCYSRGANGWEWPRGLDCAGYRLPTEAEWEYAARAGQPFAWAGSDTVAEVAWVAANSGATTHAGRGRIANAWGLFDLSGNVWEWVWDGHAAYTAAAVTDPTSPVQAPSRVLRGGSWLYDGRHARVAWRHSAGPDSQFPDVGFRLVRTVP